MTCTGHTSTGLPTGTPAGSVDLTGCSGGTGGVAVGNWVGGPNAATVPFSVLNQIGEGNNGNSKGPEKLFGNNEDYTVLRAAETTDGVHFTDLGAISGTTSGTGNDAGSYNDISNPLQTTSPSTSEPDQPGGRGASTPIELRFVGSRGTIITNPDGSLGMFLSGAWATDGDSDAYNQSLLHDVDRRPALERAEGACVSTDYTFSASAAQDAALAGGTDAPLGISAYYSGRAYGPSVVQNPDGTLTMVFSGYRLPKPIVNAGTVLGTGLTPVHRRDDRPGALPQHPHAPARADGDADDHRQHSGPADRRGGRVGLPRSGIERVRRGTRRGRWVPLRRRRDDRRRAERVGGQRAAGLFLDDRRRAVGERLDRVGRRR